MTLKRLWDLLIYGDIRSMQNDTPAPNVDELVKLINRLRIELDQLYALIEAQQRIILDQARMIATLRDPRDTDNDRT